MINWANILKVFSIIGAILIVLVIYSGDWQSPPKSEDQISTPKSDKLQIRVEPLVKIIPTEKEIIPEPPPPKSPKPPMSDPPPPPPPAPKRETREKNICERHHMVKVVTNNGRSWRCRKRHHE